jgi:hypothetical protein
VNPGIILTRVSVYGQTGPYRDRPGLDRNGIAMGGLMYITGYPDRPPVRPGLIVSDYLTGVFNAFAILAAVYERDARARADGGAPRGQWVDLSLYESILRPWSTRSRHDRLKSCASGRKTGSRTRAAGQLGDEGRQVSRIIAAGAGLPRLCRAMAATRRRSRASRPWPGAGMATDQRDHRGVGGPHTSASCRRSSSATGAVRRRVLGRRHLRRSARGRAAIETVDDPTIGPVRMQGVYPRFSRTPGRIARGAPPLGADNEAVYKGLLGLDDAALEELAREGVI